MQPVQYPLAGKRIFVAGHGGMVGSALVRRLQKSIARSSRIAQRGGSATPSRDGDLARREQTGHHVHRRSPRRTPSLAPPPLPPPWVLRSPSVRRQMAHRAAYRRERGCDFISAQPTNLYGLGDTISRPAMSFPHSWRRCTTRRSRTPPKSRSGARTEEGEAQISSTSTISPMRSSS